MKFIKVLISYLNSYYQNVFSGIQIPIMFTSTCITFINSTCSYIFYIQTITTYFTSIFLSYKSYIFTLTIGFVYYPIFEHSMSLVSYMFIISFYIHTRCIEKSRIYDIIILFKQIFYDIVMELFEFIL